MFAKRRAQNIEFSPNGGHFGDERSEGEISKKSDFSAVFEIFWTFFFDFGYFDIAFNECIKELESNTPSVFLTWLNAWSCLSIYLPSCQYQ